MYSSVVPKYEYQNTEQTEGYKYLNTANEDTESRAKRDELEQRILGMFNWKYNVYAYFRKISHTKDQ